MEKLQTVEVGLRIVEKNRTTMQSVFERPKLSKAQITEALDIKYERPSINQNEEWA